MDKLKTEEIKEVGKWLMIIGASIFSCGAGAYMVSNHIEKKDARLVHTTQLYQIEEEERAKELKLRDEAIAAATEKDRLYSEKIKSMDNKAFAKFHAENVSKANADVLAKADQITKQAEADVVKARLECNETMNKLRDDCLKKIEEADRKRDEAVRKYDAINTLFTNKDKILKAKAALDLAIEKDQQAKDDKAELIKSIKDMLE